MSYTSRPATWVTTVDKVQYEGVGAPSELMGNIGDRYFDTSTGIWFVNRVVGRVNGNDQINIPSKTVIEAKSSISCNFKTSNTFNTDTNSDIFGNEMVMKIRSALGRVVILIGNSVASGWVVSGEAITPILSNNTWYNIRVDIDNIAGVITAYVNGNKTYEKTGQSISTSKGGFRFGSIDMTPFGTLMCNCKYNDVFLPINEGVGSTLRNEMGSEIGAVVDASPVGFWTDSWVPINLSYPIV